MQAAPPPRYRVVERGRRLEVIDTWREGRPDPVSRAPAPVPVRRSPPQGGLVPFTTRRFYDAGGPRTLLVSAQMHANLRALGVAAAFLGIAAVIAGLFWWPLLLGIGVALGNPRLRERARKAVTAWLDSIDARDPAER